jgi:hypothetical protein
MDKKNISDFSIGGIIKSKEEWESRIIESEDWINRSYEERLNAIELLRQQYLELFNISVIPDFSIGGKRTNND